MRLGVVGCGAVAQHGHLPAIRGIRGVDLTAVVDADSAWVQQVARAHRVPMASTDYRVLPGKVDAAIVATPNSTHAEIAGFLVQHGVHVLCEKPAAPSADDAAELFALADAHGTRLMAAHSRRFTEGALALRTLMQLGALGSVLDAWGALGAPMTHWPARVAFRADARLAGGGCLVDSGIHLLDLLVWLLGDARVEHYCEWRPDGATVELDALVSLRFTGGTTARVACSYSHELGATLELHAECGWARLPINGSPGLEFWARDAVIGRAAGVQECATSSSPYERQLRHFVDCLQSGEPFLVQPSEVIAGLRLIEDCYARVS